VEKAFLIGIYFDLENMELFDLNQLLQDVTLKIEENTPSIFAIKLACGDTDSIAKFREQLKDLNFNIRETPHVSEKNLKNRADLILSIEAFENLYQSNPNIDLYVFITSDTDFTVIMDKLRKYGKNVWLVTKKNYKEKRLFTSSSERILVIEEYITNNKVHIKTEIVGIEKILTEIGFDDIESNAIKEVLESFDKDIWHENAKFGTKIKNIIKDFSYKGKKINSQTKLFEELRLKKYLEIKKENAVDLFKIL
jgi:hypothetical protein